jgi:hypothetical protein
MTKGGFEQAGRLIAGFKYVGLAKIFFLFLGNVIIQIRTKKPIRTPLYSIFLFFLVALGFDLRASLLQTRHSIACATSPVHFAPVILEMGFC